MLKIFDTMTRSVREFVSLKPGKVGIYACGPTVYDFAHIGHGRKYVNDDILRRVLENIEGFGVEHVQNITDVGHLVSDGDEGEDKMEKGAKKNGKTVWEVAEEYTRSFFEEMDLLNIKRPSVSCKATDHIREQIDLIKTLVEKGFAYETDEAIYFEVNKFDDYGKLFGQDLADKVVGAREEVEINNNKKNVADFVLWFKRVGKYKDHVMYWESPWGDGFPGWHVECSAMSMKYLGEQIDIHTGGEDHISIHHPNEIAQSEAATGKKPFVSYWFHSSFLMVDGQKMSKSLGNYYKVSDLVHKGYQPMALRYLYLSTHYRKTMNFTFEALDSAQNAYTKLVNFVSKTQGIKNSKTQNGEQFRIKFREVVEEDLNMPNALAVVWEVVKSDLDDGEKKGLILEMDEVLGLKLDDRSSIVDRRLDRDTLALLEQRERLRGEKNWGEADKIRDKLVAMGVEVQDK